MIDILSFSCETALSWILEDHTDDWSGSGDGLVPLPEPMLTKFYDAVWLYILCVDLFEICQEMCSWSIGMQ